MRIRKWYLDAVCDDGTVIIGYEIRARIFGFPLAFSGLYLSRPDGTSRETISWRGSAEPSLSGDRIQWSPRGVDARCEWSNIADGMSAQLAREKGFSAMWHCVTPRAGFHGIVGGTEYTGLGYVEYLELDMRYPQLPFRELLWGRAHTVDGGSLVWISWRRGLEGNWIWRDGEFAEGNMAGELPDELTVSGEKFRFVPLRVLRTRDLRSASGRFIRAVTGGLLAAREEKLLGRSISSGDNADGSGQIIYERVVWGDS
jgi:hypothetical protein